MLCLIKIPNTRGAWVGARGYGGRGTWGWGIGEGRGQETSSPGYQNHTTTGCLPKRDFAQQHKHCRSVASWNCCVQILEKFYTTVRSSHSEALNLTGRASSAVWFPNASSGLVDPAVLSENDNTPRLKPSEQHLNSNFAPL